jgi:hypothetical protein
MAYQYERGTENLESRPLILILEHKERLNILYKLIMNI